MSPARDPLRRLPTGSSAAPCGRADRCRRAPPAQTHRWTPGHFIPTSRRFRPFPIGSGRVDRRRLAPIAPRLAERYGPPPPARPLPPVYGHLPPAPPPPPNGTDPAPADPDL